MSKENQRYTQNGLKRTPGIPLKSGVKALAFTFLGMATYEGITGGKEIDKVKEAVSEAATKQLESSAEETNGVLERLQTILDTAIKDVAQKLDTSPIPTYRLDGDQASAKIGTCANPEPIYDTSTYFNSILPGEVGYIECDGRRESIQAEEAKTLVFADSAIKSLRMDDGVKTLFIDIQDEKVDLNIRKKEGNEDFVNFDTAKGVTLKRHPDGSIDAFIRLSFKGEPNKSFVRRDLDLELGDNPHSQRLAESIFAKLAPLTITPANRVPSGPKAASVETPSATPWKPIRLPKATFRNMKYAYQTISVLQGGDEVKYRVESDGKIHPQMIEALSSGGRITWPKEFLTDDFFAEPELEKSRNSGRDFYRPNRFYTAKTDARLSIALGRNGVSIKKPRNPKPASSLSSQFLSNGKWITLAGTDLFEGGADTVPAMMTDHLVARKVSLGSFKQTGEKVVFQEVVHVDKPNKNPRYLVNPDYAGKELWIGRKTDTGIHSIANYMIGPNGVVGPGLVLDLVEMSTQADIFVWTEGATATTAEEFLGKLVPAEEGAKLLAETPPTPKKIVKKVAKAVKKVTAPPRRAAEDITMADLLRMEREATTAPVDNASWHKPRFKQVNVGEALDALEAAETRSMAEDFARAWEKKFKNR